jgi:hypothetical protein
MTCYVCRAEAAGICTSCGAALCEAHFRETRTYSVGGARYGCPHLIATRQATERPLSAAPLARTTRPV